MDDIKLPRIDASTTEGKIAQIIDYLIIFLREDNYQKQDLDRRLIEIEQKMQEANEQWH